jgi:hypothetical protein
MDEDALIARLNRLTIKLDRPKITDDNVNKPEYSETAASDPQPLRYVQAVRSSRVKVRNHQSKTMKGSL